METANPETTLLVVALAGEIWVQRDEEVLNEEIVVKEALVATVA